MQFDDNISFILYEWRVPNIDLIVSVMEDQNVFERIDNLIREQKEDDFIVKFPFSVLNTRLDHIWIQTKRKPQNVKKAVGAKLVSFIDIDCNKLLDPIITVYLDCPINLVKSAIIHELTHAVDKGCLVQKRKNYYKRKTKNTNLNLLDQKIKYATDPREINAFIQQFIELLKPYKQEVLQSIKYSDSQLLDILSKIFYSKSFNEIPEDSGLKIWSRHPKIMRRFKMNLYNAFKES